MRTERADINQLLQQMKQMQTQMSENRGVGSALRADALGMKQGLGEIGADNKIPGFGEMFRQAIDSVNATQQQSSAMATSFEQGDPGVSLAQVMVASQKASVSFQALTQVRNKLVDAYKDIMNMPI